MCGTKARGYLDFFLFTSMQVHPKIQLHTAPFSFIQSLNLGAFSVFSIGRLWGRTAARQSQTRSKYCWYLGTHRGKGRMKQATLRSG